MNPKKKSLPFIPVAILILFIILSLSGCSKSSSPTTSSLSSSTSKSAINSSSTTTQAGNNNSSSGSFQGTITGSWTGKAQSTAVGGQFTMTVGTDGSIQGNFGPDSTTWFGGSFTGQIDSSGNLKASGNGNSGGQTTTTWQGKLSKSGIAYSIQGNWTYSQPKSAGTFSGAETSRVTNVLATTEVGSNAVGLVYDSGKNEIFVSNYDDNTVSVISDDTNAVVATVKVGTWPTALAYDSAKGEVFVISHASGSISVISDTTNQIVATITGSTSAPNGIVYDSPQNELFASTGTGVAVISDTNNTIVKNIPLQNCYGPIAYDSGKSEIFVADDAGVSVVSDTSNSVVASIAIPYGSGIGNLVYDSTKGEVFANSALIVVISDKTNTIGTTIKGFSAGALTYDPKVGEIFVSGKQPYPGTGTQITVVSDSDNKVTTTLMGTGGALIYDSGKDEIISTNVTTPGMPTNKVVVVKPPD